jgi:conjugal transfer pilus assembly protein TrbC
MVRPMKFSSVHALAGCAIVLALSVASSQQLPDDSAIAREAAKQAPRSSAAIDKAERQSRVLRQAVPDVSPPAPLPLPDPAAVAQRYEPLAPSVPGLFVLVSLSMPSQSLERLASQAGRANATLVLRGVVDGSLKKTAELSAEVLRKHPGAQFQIDPTLFRRFGVTQVPAFVLSSRPGADKTCGNDCDANNSFARVSGDVSLDYALEHMAKQGDPRFAPLAESRLKMLRAGP